jgi:hypothetical protein
MGDMNPSKSKRLQALANTLEAVAAKTEQNNASDRLTGTIRHNTIDPAKLQATINEMRAKGTAQISLNEAELIRETTKTFEEKIIPKLYRGKVSLPDLARNPSRNIAEMANSIKGILDIDPKEPQPIFIHSPDIMVDANLHAWGAVMCYVSRGILNDKKFLKVDESELLAKNRAGYMETQKNVALAEQDVKVVLFSASDVDTYSQTEATTLATLFKGWAEEQVAIIIVSPRPFNLWLKRLPRDVQPILNTLYMGHVVEPATPQTGTMEQSGLNHSVLNILQ